MNNKLAKNTFIYALGDIVPKALSFFTFPILTTYLSPADYGVVNYVNTVILLLTIVGFLCLNTYYLVYYFKVNGEVEQKRLLGSLSIFIVLYNIILSTILFFLGYFFPFFFSSKIDFFPYIAIGIVSNFFNLFSILPSALYRVQERPLPLTLLNVLKGCMTMVLTLVLVVKFGFTALGVLLSTLFINVIFGIIFAQITIKNMEWSIDWLQIRCALKFSIPLLPGALSYYLLSMADRIFIEKYLTLTDLGLYSTASTFAMLLNIMSFGAYKAFEPHFFKIYGTKEFSSQFIKIFNVYLCVILLTATSLSMFAKEFFVLFATEAYHEVYFYVPLIELGIVFSSMSILFSTIVTAREKTKLNSMITILGGIVSCVINIVLLPLIGIVAACIASGVSFGLMMILAVYFSNVKMSFLRHVLSLCLSIIAVWLSVYIISIDNFWLNASFKSILLLILSLSILKILNILNIRVLKFLCKPNSCC